MKPTVICIDGRFYREILEEVGMTCAEFGAFYQISDDTVRRLVKSGKIRRMPGTKEIRIPLSEIARLKVEAADW